MNGKIAWSGAVLLVSLVTALYLFRDSGPETGRPAAGLAPDRSALAHAERLPAPALKAPAREEAQSLTSKGRDEPANGNSADSATASKPASGDPRLSAHELSAHEREFIARLFAPPGPDATDQERLMWEESPVSDLLYPAGHPCAGQPLDSVSPALLAAAGKDGLGKLIDAIPDVDEPQCVYQGKWPFHPLNQSCSGVNRENAELVARCTNYLLTAQQDSRAYPATIWLPCLDGGQATTLRAYFEDLLAQQVAQVFAGPRCEAS